MLINYHLAVWDRRRNRLHTYGLSQVVKCDNSMLAE